MILVPSGTSWRGRVEHGEAEQGFIHQVEWFAVQAKNLDDDNLSLSLPVSMPCVSMKVHEMVRMLGCSSSWGSNQAPVCGGVGWRAVGRFRPGAVPSCHAHAAHEH